MRSGRKAIRSYTVAMDGGREKKGREEEERNNEIGGSGENNKKWIQLSERDNSNSAQPDPILLSSLISGVDQNISVVSFQAYYEEERRS